MAKATPRAWLPADAATTPRARSADAERGEHVERAAHLERARRLPALELEPGLAPGHREGAPQRRRGEVGRERLPRLLDVRPAEQAASSRHSLTGPPATRSSRGSGQCAAMSAATRSRSATTARHPSPSGATASPIQRWIASRARHHLARAQDRARPAQGERHHGHARLHRRLEGAQPERAQARRRRERAFGEEEHGLRPARARGASLPASATLWLTSKRSTVRWPARRTSVPRSGPGQPTSALAANTKSRGTQREQGEHVDVGGVVGGEQDGRPRPRATLRPRA